MMTMHSATASADKITPMSKSASATISPMHRFSSSLYQNRILQSRMSIVKARFWLYPATNQMFNKFF
jgi:hypothetical protein